MKMVKQIVSLMLCFMLVFQAEATVWGTELTDVQETERQEPAETQAPETGESTSVGPGTVQTPETADTPEETGTAGTPGTTEEPGGTGAEENPSPAEIPEPEETPESTDAAGEQDPAESPGETGVTEDSAIENARAASHIAALANTLVDGFADESQWGSIGSVAIADGKLAISGTGPFNGAVWKQGKIDVDQFLISMDVTPKMAQGQGADLKVAFKCADQTLTGDYLVVRIQMGVKKFIFKRHRGRRGSRNLSIIRLAILHGRRMRALDWTFWWTVQITVLTYI